MRGCSNETWQQYKSSSQKTKWHPGVLTQVTKEQVLHKTEDFYDNSENYAFLDIFWSAAVYGPHSVYLCFCTWVETTCWQPGQCRVDPNAFSLTGILVRKFVVCSGGLSKQKRTVEIINCDDNMTRFVCDMLGNKKKAFFSTWTPYKEICSFLLYVPSHSRPNCHMPASVFLGITSKIPTEGYCARLFPRLRLCCDAQTSAKVIYEPQLLGRVLASPSTCQIHQQGAQHTPLQRKGRRWGL